MNTFCNIQPTWRYEDTWVCEKFSVENFYNMILAGYKIAGYTKTRFGGTLTQWHSNPIDLYAPRRYWEANAPRYWSTPSKVKLRAVAYIRFRRNIFDLYHAERCIAPPEPPKTRTPRTSSTPTRPKKLNLKPIQDVSPQWRVAYGAHSYQRRIVPFIHGTQIVAGLLSLNQKALKRVQLVWTKWGSAPNATPTTNLSAPRDVVRFRRQIFRFMHEAKSIALRQQHAA